MKRKEPIIIIPSAGMGSRFIKEGFVSPKPFIEINNKPLIHHVFDNFTQIDNNVKFIVITRGRGSTEYLSEISLNYNLTIVGIEALTKGTAISLLSASHLISNENPVIVANCDQIINNKESLLDLYKNASNGISSLITFECSDMSNKWSYVKRDLSGNNIIEVKEKEVISNEACTGVFGFESGSSLIKGIIQMIEKKDTTNGEFYVAPIYNYLIKEGKQVKGIMIEENEMLGLGTPADLEKNKYKIDYDK